MASAYAARARALPVWAWVLLVLVIAGLVWWYVAAHQPRIVPVEVSQSATGTPETEQLQTGAVPGTMTAPMQLAAFGPYKMQYNAISSLDIPAQVARQLGIDRAADVGVLTVSVFQGSGGAGGLGQQVPASVSAYTTNLNDQLSNISMRQVKEQNALYYIGEFGMTPPETRKFHVSVTPQGSNQSHAVDFSQQFYAQPRLGTGDKAKGAAP